MTEVIRILIHNQNDIVFTMAKNGTIRSFQVDANGAVLAVDMVNALDAMAEVEIHGAD